MDELIASGTLEDFTSNQTQLDRELAQMASQSQVESDLAKLKQEVGSGDEQKQLPGGEDVPPIRAVPPEEKAENQ
jgi:phage shock protein A